MAILKVIQDFGNWFWGIPILILIGGGGLFLTIYLGFPQLRHFGYAMSQSAGSGGTPDRWSGTDRRRR